jgi:hypothetical protein
MPFDIATGTYSDADPVLPLADTGSGITALAGVTPVAGQLTPADQTPEMNYTAMLTADMAAGEADARAAQASAMAAEDSRRRGYEAQAIPLGGQIGDNLVMPVVPDNAVVAASSDDYPWPGDEPLPSSAGPSYGGNEPSNAA